MAEFENVYASLVSFCQDFITTEAPGAEFVDFDQHATIGTLPKKDLIGLRSLAIDFSTPTFDVEVLFCVSTEPGTDASLFRHRALLGGLLPRLMPSCNIPYLDAETGMRLGQLNIANGTQLVAMSRVDIRAFQQVAVTLLGDRGLEPRTS